MKCKPCNNEIEVLAIKPTADKFRFVVLRVWNDCTPWVVHSYDAKNHGYMQGDYCFTWEQALEQFNKRSW